MKVLQPKIDDGTLVVGSGQTDIKQAATAAWKSENAQNRMDALLTSTYRAKSIDGVLSPNDMLARAIITSVKSTGKPIPVVKDLQAGKKAEVNDTKSYDNGVKIVPAFLLSPVIVTKANAAEAYANDPILEPLTK